MSQKNPRDQRDEELPGPGGHGGFGLHISWWPHWWAIPLTLFVGVLIGWLLRAQLDGDDAG